MPSGPRRVPGPRQARPGRQRRAQQARSQDATEPRAPRPQPDRAEDGRIADAIRPIVHASGMDLESVRVSAAGRRRVLRVVVDSDRGVSLDDAARISRELSAALDRLDVMGDFPYTLEVSSPGVDRPLTEPRHWRRATGRLVLVPLIESGEVLAARIVLADEEAVIMDTEGVRSRFPYPVLGPGKIQVEFAAHADEADEADEPDDGATRDGH